MHTNNETAAADACNHDLSEVKQIMAEVEQLFSRNDDIKDVLELKSMQKEIQVLSQARHQEAKEIIKGKCPFEVWTLYVLVHFSCTVQMLLSDDVASSHEGVRDHGH